MVSSILIKDFSKDKAMVVPSAIIRKDKSGDYVYVAVEKEGEWIAEKRNVTVSTYTYNDETLIDSGLHEGDMVVTEGYHMISSGVPVKIIG